jgi:hypothetical protein
MRRRFISMHFPNLRHKISTPSLSRCHSKWKRKTRRIPDSRITIKIIEVSRAGETSWPGDYRKITLTDGTSARVQSRERRSEIPPAPGDSEHSGPGRTGRPGGGGGGGGGGEATACRGRRCRRYDYSPHIVIISSFSWAVVGAVCTSGRLLSGAVAGGGSRGAAARGVLWLTFLASHARSSRWRKMG